ncbi:Uncharacterised protein [Mycobacteroides abscessus subsp. abscessus]|uniref:sce7726 family protein n=1 Tax=Mycobacteroides abscessus TaxID=36809 RepID=UPI0009275F33|nr:Uncharacterised protein [Mycobacteroides abscessus subsp. abscessus]SLL32991.1 Uncharacterised protein [Mycobacteroides abscessus subsp. abscessus]
MTLATDHHHTAGAVCRPSRGGDSTARAAVHASLDLTSEGRPLVVDEFVIGEVGRIDIAVIGSSMHGYELKSDRDTLHRLPRQMEIYGQVFDYCTLVVAPRHLAEARTVLRQGWGLAVLVENPTGMTEVRKVRTAKPNKGVRADVLAQLLWRDEALAALNSLNADVGFRSKPRADLWNRLCEITDLPELKQIVRTALKERRGWRDGSSPFARGVKYRPEDMSSRFLARRVR